jgi:xanthine dehydrogenase accessory factor
LVWKNERMTLRILVRGGGDLASGVVMRLYRAGWQVLVTELPQPRAVRRLVSFAQSVYDGQVMVEGIMGRRIETAAEIEMVLAAGEVPVLVDPSLASAAVFQPHVVIDCRMLKRPPEDHSFIAPFEIGIGPGFTAGKDCHAVIETNRGPHLGRVIWSGSAQDDTRTPEKVGVHRGERVLRAPIEGPVAAVKPIGTLLKEGDIVARVAGAPVVAPFDGVLRGMIQDGIVAEAGEKIGDIDPRGDVRLCWLVSDKALSIGGGVLEAVLSWQPLRQVLYTEEIK